MTGKGMFDYGVLINTCGPKERKQCREENKDRKREKKDMIKRYKKREIVFANSEEMREFDMCIDSINDEIERCKKCRPYVIAAIFPPKE
jgi:3-methyladenine DNA glycosylase Tag